MNFIPKHLERLEANFTLPKATFIIAALTLLSRGSGLIRTRLFTSKFGASETLDIYFTAFRIPDFIMNLLVLGTLTVALLPIFTQYLVKDKRKAYDLANSVFTLSFVGMIASCLIILIFLRPLTHWLAPGFSEESLAQTVLLTQYILVAQIIFAVSNLYTTVLNAHKRFFIAALAPVLYNIGIITGLLVFYPRYGIPGLGMGVILGSLLHIIFQAIESGRLGFFWKLSLNIRHPGLRQVIALYIPRVFFIDLSQISLIVSSILGSLLIAGSISVFNLAFDVAAVPTGIFAISTAIAAFPVLSESFASGSKKTYWETLAKATNQILFFIIPISVGILIFRAYIVRILFGAGEFNWEDTIATFQVLGIFSFSLFSQALLPLYSSAFYARHNTHTPMLVGIVCIIVSVAVSYALTPELGILGVAYGFTSASIVNIIVLYMLLRKKLVEESSTDHSMRHGFDRKLAISFSKIIAASFALGIVSFITLRLVAPLVNTRTGLGILIQSGTSALAGGLAFLIISQYLKIEESSRLIRQLKSIFIK